MTKTNFSKNVMLTYMYISVRMLLLTNERNYFIFGEDIEGTPMDCIKEFCNLGSKFMLIIGQKVKHGYNSFYRVV